jgi:site-specific DNA-cytosine methylase
MRVLSLFNGMNTGRVASENQGFKVEKYYSSEIKKHAIKLTQYHYPDTIQLGNILNWRSWEIDFSKIDLILSGSPCQDLSIAGKRKGITGEKSILFFTFIDILNHIKKLNPNILFLQENVGSAKDIDIGIMSRALGVYPVRINSKLLTAQLRDRYYWTNIKTRKTLFDIVTDIPQPEDKKIFFKDILTDGYTDRKKARAILESDGRSFSNNMKRAFYRYKKFGNLVFLKNERPFKFTGNNVRVLNKIELCRLQGFPDNYCDILNRVEAVSLLGDGWTLPVIEHIFKFINHNGK